MLCESSLAGVIDEDVANSLRRDYTYVSLTNYAMNLSRDCNERPASIRAAENSSRSGHGLWHVSGGFLTLCIGRGQGLSC